MQVVATVPATGCPPEVVDIRRASLILLGLVGSGLPQEFVARADATLTIAMRPGID
jgi:tRNA G18 (ribose-2'-O)-methylase SpoU